MSEWMPQREAKDDLLDLHVLASVTKATAHVGADVVRIDISRYKQLLAAIERVTGKQLD